MEITMKPQPLVHESHDYKHKKFDAPSKRIRYDSSSSTQSSATSTYELTTRNNDTSLSMKTDFNNFQSGCNKRNWLSSTPETAEEPALKRRRLLKTETNDSGFLMSTPTIDDDDLRLTPAPPRFTSTPLTAFTPRTTTTITPLKRNFHQINDSGLSMTPRKVEDDVTSVASSSHRLAFSHYNASPLTVLAAVATTTTSSKPTPPTALIMPQISDEIMHNICKYHGNMVRKFPKKERTTKDQERRNKNTIACRMSRRLKKLENVAIEEQYKEFSKQHFDIMEASIRATAYLNALTMKLTAVNSGVIERPIERSISLSTGQLKSAAIGLRKPKPFSIEYLTGQSSSS